MRNSYVLMLGSLVGLVTSGCALMPGSSSPDIESTRQARAALRRVQSCSDLESALKTDAKAKLNQRFDELAKAIREGEWAPYEGGGLVVSDQLGNGGPGTVTNESSGSGSAAPPTAGSAGRTNGPARSGTPTRDESKSQGSSPSTASGNAAPAPASTGSGAGAATDYSRTNTQFEGVDEADIVKTDGSNVYVIHGQEFRVVKAWPANALATTARVSLEGEPHEFFVEGKHAVIYSTVGGQDVYAAAAVTPRSAGGGVASADMPAQDRAGSSSIEPSAPNGPVMPGAYQAPLTKITVLDLSGSVPAVSRELYFEGSYVSARRINSKIHTVIRASGFAPGLQDPWAALNSDGTLANSKEEALARVERARATALASIDAQDTKSWLPYSMTKSGSTMTASIGRCEDFWVPGVGSSEFGVTTLETIDLADPTAPAQSQSILAVVDTVMGTEGSLYLAANAWTAGGFPMGIAVATPAAAEPIATSPGTPGASTEGNSGSGVGFGAPSEGAKAFTGLQIQSGSAPMSEVRRTVNSTYLHKFDISQPKPMYVASGEVDGSVANQFSLDEKDGVLRVSTTQDELKIVGAGVTQSATQTRTSNVFILRQEGSRLAVKGSVRNLAPGESIMSTRFVGRYGYVVTFLQKDPLFVVDLADEMNPKVLGQLTIPGFSSYMHPIDDGHLLTIGQDADGNGRTTGLALQVFDVTAPTSPRLAHKFTFQGNDYGYSEASQNHKAFTYYASKKLLAFPYVSSGPQGFRSTLEVFDVDPTQGIRRRGAVDHSKLFTSPVGYCGGYYGVDVRRGLFMDNNLVSISYGGIVTSSLDNLTQAVATLPFEAPPVASLPYCGSGASTEPSGPVTSKPAPATATPAPRAP